MADANFCQEMFRDHLLQERYNHYTVFITCVAPALTTDVVKDLDWCHNELPFTVHRTLLTAS